MPRATRGEKDPAVQMKMKGQSVYCCWQYRVWVLGLPLGYSLG